MQLDAGVLVEGGVVGGEAEGGLKGAAGLLRVALFEGGVAGGHEIFGFFGALALLGGFVLEVGLEVHHRGVRHEFFALQLEGAGPILKLPFVAEGDAPSDVFEREIELGREQLQIERARTRGANAGAVIEFNRRDPTVRDAASGRAGLIERDEDAVLLAPGPDAVLIDESEPEAGVLGQREVEEAFVAREDLQAHLGEHDSVVGNDRGQGDVVDAGGEEFGGLAAFELEGQKISVICHAIGEVSRG